LNQRWFKAFVFGEELIDPRISSAHPQVFKTNKNYPNIFLFRK